MDHYEEARKAFDERRYLEVLAHLERLGRELTAHEACEVSRLNFLSARALGDREAWRLLKAWVARIEDGAHALEVASEHLALVPAEHLEFYHELCARIFFQRGELGRACASAKRHIDLLFSKKALPQLAAATEKYRRQFPHELSLLFTALSVAALAGDPARATESYQELQETVRRRWHKLEGIGTHTRAEVLAMATQAVEQLDTSSGEAVILQSYALLCQRLQERRRLSASEWKKLLELVVYDANWRHLKLALEHALLAEDSELATEVLRQLKLKPGFSVVKLTRFDAHIRDFYFSRKPQAEAPAYRSPLTAEDLRLTENAPTPVATSVADPEVPDEELKTIELNAISQIAHVAPPVDVLFELVITYKTLGFQRVTGWILRRLSSGVDLSEKQRKKLAYLSVIHSIDCGQDYHALAVLEELLGDSALGLDELKELKYVQGSVYQRLGFTAEAAAAYAVVAALDPAYRRLSERIASLGPR